ncbi:MAG: ABC transporter ATP-binding protein [Candidatus Rokubacteria bacterium]|nr:ABC transporter ATP-binding protein [Candidatus Rokubacteria bacterium]
MTAAAHAGNGRLAASPQAPLLAVRNLAKHFPLYQPWLLGFVRREVGLVPAVEDVSFTIQRGEALGLVGESGCGKTTTARLILRALKPTRGEILFNLDGAVVRVDELEGKPLRALRRHIQLIFQDPVSSLNPRMPVGEIIAEPLKLHRMGRSAEITERVKTLMSMVGLDVQYLRRYPHSFSGGQRQRIGIARALALNPELVVCDEPVSALDVSIQAQVLNLLKDLQAELGLTYLFISHNLAVIDYVADRVAVMYAGRIVEMASKRELFANPKHPYTEALLAAVLQPDPRLRPDHQALAGDGRVQAPPVEGCAYAPRCGYAVERCRVERPELTEVAPDHLARCHRVGEIQLAPLLRRPRLPPGRAS